MDIIDFCELRRKLDDAITYADFDVARQLAKEGLIHAQSQELLGESAYFKAQAEIINENYKEAINCLDLAIKHNPSDGAAYNDRALCIIELGEDETQSLADFDKGIVVEPDYASVYHNKGWYLNKLGRHQEAIPYFEKTLELEPDRAVTYENLADTYLNLGEKQKAIKALQKALQCLNPSRAAIKDQLEARIKMLEGNMFWKIYFWFLCLALIGGYATAKSFGAAYAVDLIISFPSIVGFFLYVYKKRWLNVRFWKVYVLIYFLWDICFNCMILPKIDGKGLSLETAFGFIFIVPMWIALYLYAFKFLPKTKKGGT